MRKMMQRLAQYGIRKILADPVRRRDLLIRAGIAAAAAADGRDRTYEQMAEAYDRVHGGERDSEEG